MPLITESSAAIIAAVVAGMFAIIAALIAKATKSAEEMLAAVARALAVVMTVVGVGCLVFLAGLFVLRILGDNSSTAKPSKAPSSSYSPSKSTTTEASSRAVAESAQRFLQDEYAPEVDSRTLGDEGFVREFFTQPTFQWFGKTRSAKEFAEAHRGMPKTCTTSITVETFKSSGDELTVGVSNSRTGCGIEDGTATIKLVKTLGGEHDFRISSFDD